jgi:hypothetical protein
VVVGVFVPVAGVVAPVCVVVAGDVVPPVAFVDVLPEPVATP